MSPILRKVSLFLSILPILLLAVAHPARAEESVRLNVAVYLDTNGDKIMSDGEGIENVLVIVDVDGHRQARSTRGGLVSFTLPYANIQTIHVEVPYFALADEVKPRDNLAEVDFRLKSPELPVYLP